MDFGVFLPVSGSASHRSGLITAAKRAEEWGFTTVWAADRIVIPWEIETPYAYNWTGSFFVPPEKPFLEPLTALAFLAGATEKIRLGISVLVMPYRNPVYWAKIAATIDWLSEGRFVLGIGIGWMREEFAALGADFAHRGLVADEQLSLARALFTLDHVTFHGDRYHLDDIAFEPKAFDREHPIPIWAGGEGLPAQRRAGRFADAWFPYFPRITPGELRRRMDRVRLFAGESGRDPEQVRFNCCLAIDLTERSQTQEPDLLRGNPGQIAERLRLFQAEGVEHVGLQFLVGRFPERLEQMQRFSEEVLPQLR
ncbi:MAG: TIGR03619 family F420-dependent LLM class oxidoreductase [Candidatus Dormibacteraceae bacterium]